MFNVRRAAISLGPFGFLCVFSAAMALPLEEYPDISKNVELVGSIGGNQGTVRVAGSAAFVADDDYMTILDVSDPTDPRTLSRIRFGNRVSDIQIAQKVAVVEVKKEGLGVVDISDLAKPKLADFVRSDYQWTGFTLHDSMLYFANDALEIYDLSNPSDPKFLGQTEGLGRTSGVSVYGTTAYVFTWGHRGAFVNIVDIADPAKPQEEWFGKLDEARPFSIRGTTAYTAGDVSLDAYDLTDPLSPQLLGQAEVSIDPHSLALSGSLAFLACTQEGLVTVDVSDSSHPRKVSALRPFPGCYSTGVAASGKEVYLADGVSGLWIFDASNPTSPTLEGRYDVPGRDRGEGALRVALSGSVATVLEETFEQETLHWLKTIDISDPTVPKLMGAISTKANIADIVSSGTLVYALKNNSFSEDKTQGLLVFDVSNPRKPFLRGSLDVAARDTLISLSVNGSQIGLHGKHENWIVDASHPDTLRYAGRGHEPVLPTENATTTGALSVVRTEQHGIEIRDTSDPRNPRLLGWFRCPGPQADFKWYHGLLYLVDGEYGLLILRYKPE